MQLESYTEELSFDFAKIIQISEPQKLIYYIIEKYLRHDFNLAIYKSSWPQEPTLLQTPFKLFGKDTISSLIENDIIACINGAHQINPHLKSIAKKHANNDGKLFLSYQSDYTTLEWQEIYSLILLGEIPTQAENNLSYTMNSTTQQIQNIYSSQTIINNQQTIYLTLSSQHEIEPTYNQEESRKLFVRLMATLLFKLMEISLSNNRVVTFDELYLNSGLQNISSGFSEDLKNKLLEIGVLITIPKHSTKNYVVNTKAISALQVHAWLKNLHFSIYSYESTQTISIAFDYEDVCQLANILIPQKKPISTNLAPDPNDDYIPTMPSFN